MKQQNDENPIDSEKKNLQTPVGFNNQGCTCYMDSALQVITHSKYIAEALVKNDNNKYLAVSAGAKLVKMIGSVKTTTPSEIKRIVGSKHRIFQGFGQQDSHEFISNYLEDAHNELRGEKKQYVQVEYSGTDVKESYQKFKEVIDTFEKSDLNDAVSFVVLKEFECCACKAKSFSFQQDASLVLDLRFVEKLKQNSQKQVEEPQQQFRFSYYSKQQNYSTTLLACLGNHFEKHTQVQKTCVQCSKIQEHEMQQSLFSAPKQLLIVLKRFDERSQKINHSVEYYPQLKLDEYFSAESNQKIASYKLDAVSLHSGGLGGGHYTAYVVKDDVAWDCNDSWIGQCTVDYKDSRAYVLSYSQIE